MKLWHNYIGKKYLINNPDGKVLQDGDLVIAHFSEGVQLNMNQQPMYGFIRLDYNKSYLRLLKLPNETFGQENRIEEYLFNILEPVSWWSEEHRTIQSPIFKSLAAMLGIKYESLRGMPGFVDDIVPEYFEIKSKFGTEIHSPTHHILIEP